MKMAAKSRIVKIGNSHGVRIPRLMLEQAGLRDRSEVKIEADPQRLVIRPNVRKVREGWAEAFKKMAEHGDDKLLDKERATKWDETEWQW